MKNYAFSTFLNVKGKTWTKAAEEVNQNDLFTMMKKLQQVNRKFSVKAACSGSKRGEN